MYCHPCLILLIFLILFILLIIWASSLGKCPDPFPPCDPVNGRSGCKPSLGKSESISKIIITNKLDTNIYAKVNGKIIPVSLNAHETKIIGDSILDFIPITMANSLRGTEVTYTLSTNGENWPNSNTTIPKLFEGITSSTVHIDIHGSVDNIIVKIY